MSAEEFLRDLRDNPPPVEEHRTERGLVCLCTSCRNNRRGANR